MIPAAPDPAPTCVFNQILDHILKDLLGLKLTGLDNINVEMFHYKGMRTWYEFEVVDPKIFRNWTIIKFVGGNQLD